MLEHIIGPGGYKSLDTLSDMSDLNRSTAYRILKTLEQAGFVRHAADGGGYGIGPRLIGLAATTMHQEGWQTLRFGALERLTEVTKETAVLSMRYGDNRVSVGGAESTAYALRRRLVIGEVYPLNSGCAARAILAFLSVGDQAEILARLGVAAASIDTACQELAVVRAQGYVISKGENHAGISGIAVPVLRDGAPLASITCGGPHDRWTEVRMLEAVEAMRAAADIIAGEL